MNQYPCEACGARLEFAVGTTSLACPYCGHRQDMPVDVTAVVREHSFAAWAAADDKPTGHVGPIAVRCTGCGAHTETDHLSGACPFCGAPIVLEPDATTMITPEAVLPFAVPRDEALTGFRTWIASRWFAPGTLTSLASHEGIHGTYLPHWTFDSDTTTRYRGQRGDHYWVTETSTDSEGRTQTRQVRHTRWSSTSGTVRRTFDDELVPAVTSLPGKALDDLEPWDLDAVTPFRPEFLAGFQTLRYEVDPGTGLKLFQESASEVIESDCRRDIGGDEQRLFGTETDWGEVTFKLLLLPVWLAAYRYRERVWRVMINARTGEVIGERPYSAWKIAAAVTAVLTLVALLVTAYHLTRS